MEVKTVLETTVALKLPLGFRQRYGTTARVFRAPGRVNLIGEHTDYNDGFVMPAAIDLSVWAAIAPCDDRKLVVHSENFSESAEIDLDDRDPRPRNQWSDYVQGVAVMLDGTYPSLRGADLLIRWRSLDRLPAQLIGGQTPYTTASAGSGRTALRPASSADSPTCLRATSI